MSYEVMSIGRELFLRLLAHAPEALRLEANEKAWRAIPALCFTEDDLRQKLAQEEGWDDLSEDTQDEAIEWLLHSGDYCYLNDNFAGLARLSFLSGMAALSFHSSN
ncbi:MAG TPA: hypothetical protein VKD91_19580, partial [Pyrinomonadaceae bacterium]|nr:hypothetical protein [Pyrinomonadaceae bacterium]